jgi:tripartite-type tricarboxylate transporter receptor subunit TctC
VDVWGASIGTIERANPHEANSGSGPEIVEKLNKEINAALADPNMKARVADLGGDVLAISPADFGKLIADETEKWGNVVRAANIKPG